MDYSSKRKYSAANPAYQRVFFEFSEEPASQPLPPGKFGARPALMQRSMH